jgi:hypothetical protein
VDSPVIHNEGPRYEAPPPGGAGGGQYPPPNYPYPPTYPAPPSKSSSPWLWIGIGCLVVGVLAIIAISICVYALLRNPDFKRSMSAMTQEMPRMQQCQQQLTSIGQALDRYAADHGGQYPNTLTELVPRYMKDASAFVCPSAPPGEQYTYKKPDRSAPGSTPVIECDRHEAGIVVMKLVLHKDGSVTQGR